MQRYRPGLVDAHRVQLLTLGPRPIADGGMDLLLNRFYVEVVGLWEERTDAAVIRVLETLRAHDDGQLRVDGCRLGSVVPPDQVSRP